MTRSVAQALASVLAVALAATAGCSGVEELHLELDGEAECTASRLAETTVVSVELLGSGPEGQLCALAKRCLFDVDAPMSVEDLETVLQEAVPPLIETDASGATTVAVFAHRTSCWLTDDLTAFGFRDLADAQGDTLAITLRCDTSDAGVEIPFCP